MTKREQFSNGRPIQSQLADTFEGQGQDLFSEVVGWLASHSLFVFVVSLLCLMLLSISCDQVCGNESPNQSGARVTSSTGMNI